VEYIILTNSAGQDISRVYKKMRGSHSGIVKKMINWL